MDLKEFVYKDAQARTSGQKPSVNPRIKVQMPRYVSFSVPSFLIMFFLLFAADAHATSGNDWKGKGPVAQANYIFGVLDTWDIFLDLGPTRPIIPEHGGFVSDFTRITECMRSIKSKRMTYGQIVAIVEKYMENNPSMWHHVMAWLVLNAVDEACEPTSK